MAEKLKLTHSVLERLMHYYICLEGYGLYSDKQWVSSSQLADYFNMDDTLVRKDLAKINVRGKAHHGYEREKIISAIKVILGLDKHYKAIVVGMGRLGSAIAGYQRFQNLGLTVVSVFDNDPAKIGQKVNGFEIIHTRYLKDTIQKENVTVAILTCPVMPAQILAEQLVDAGIKAIWNFAPTNLKLSEKVLVRNEHISVGLSELTYHLKKSLP